MFNYRKPLLPIPTFHSFEPRAMPIRQVDLIEMSGCRYYVQPALKGIRMYAKCENDQWKLFKFSGDPETGIEFDYYTGASALVFDGVLCEDDVYRIVDVVDPLLTMRERAAILRSLRPTILGAIRVEVVPTAVHTDMNAYKLWKQLGGRGTVFKPEGSMYSPHSTECVKLRGLAPKTKVWAVVESVGYEAPKRRDSPPGELQAQCILPSGCCFSANVGFAKTPLIGEFVEVECEKFMGCPVNAVLC